MAIYHLSMQTISRGKGKSAVASAAYRSCEKMINEYDDVTHDYSNKKDLVYKEIFAPDNSPDWVHDREKLWNEVEKIETRKNAQLGRELNVALPVELDFEKQKELVKNFTSGEFVSKGMIADISIHDKGEGNPHAHIMLTRREIDKDGFGEVRKDWTGTQEYFKGRSGDAQKEVLEGIRRKWAEYVNKALEHVGSQERVDYRSFKDQGIEKEPTIHEGATVRKMKSKGIETEKGAYNRRVEANNKMLELIDRQIIALEKQKEVLEHGRDGFDGDNDKANRASNGLARVEKDIFYGRTDGSKREGQVSGRGNDKFIGADKKESAVERRREGEIKESTQRNNEETRRTDGEVKGNSSRGETRHGGLEESEYNKVGNELKECERSDTEERKDEYGLVKSHDGNGKGDREIDGSGKKDTSTNVDRESQDLRSNVGNNSRGDGIDNWDSKGDPILDDIVKSLGDSIKRYHSKEDEKEKQVEKGMKRILKSEQKIKSKGKGRDYDLDFDRDKGMGR